MSLGDFIMTALPIATFFAGYAAARFEVRQRQRRRRDLAAELRSPVDADFQVVVRHAEGAG